MLQFITNTKSTATIGDQIHGVIAGGCRWVQIRMKDASDDEIRTVVNNVKPLCVETETFLILDDRVELAKELEVSGVHLGKTDMPVTQARAILGAGAVIGATANSYDDILRLRASDVDYFGIGPFKYTETKQNLAPLLGAEGIAEICRRMREDEIEIPTVAIGGITLDDVETVMKTGVMGIAVSGAIASAADIPTMTALFLEKLKTDI